jgi:hypothetical protein
VIHDIPPQPATLAELHMRPEHTSSWSARCGNLYRDLSTQQQETLASSVCSMSRRFSTNPNCSRRPQCSLKQQAIWREHLPPPMCPLPSLFPLLKFFWFLSLAIHYIPLIISQHQYRHTMRTPFAHLCITVLPHLRTISTTTLQDHINYFLLPFPYNRKPATIHPCLYS